MIVRFYFYVSVGRVLFNFQVFFKVVKFFFKGQSKFLLCFQKEFVGENVSVFFFVQEYVGFFEVDFFLVLIEDGIDVCLVYICCCYYFILSSSQYGEFCLVG